MITRVEIDLALHLAIHYGQCCDPSHFDEHDTQLFDKEADDRESEADEEFDRDQLVSGAMIDYASDSDAGDIEIRARHCYQAGIQLGTDALRAVLDHCRSLDTRDRAEIMEIIAQQESLCTSQYTPLIETP